MPNGDENNQENGGSSGGVLTDDPFFDIIGALLAVLLLARLAERLPEVLAGRYGSLSNALDAFLASTTYGVIYTGAVLFSLVCFSGAIYASMQRSQIRKEERRELNSLTHAAVSGIDTKNERWQHILSYAASDNHELWRLAIIEADVMLDEMLETMGYPQDSLGDKLKSVERSDFRTIEQAWEAHKTRNVIAHKGSTYELTREEVERTIDLYRQVFNEFEYI